MLECSYFIDPSGAGSFPTSATGLLPVLDVIFPTSPSAVGGLAVDGTATVNQTKLSVTNQSIATWPAGAALWLVWSMVDDTGKAQGLALDNLSFSAAEDSTAGNSPTLNIQNSTAGLLMSWPTVSGQSYQIEYKDDLNLPTWIALGSPLVGTGATMTVTNDTTVTSQRYYRLRLAP
jgi:hypothetical protein